MTSLPAISYQNAEFHYEPYPVGIVRQVFPPDLYQQCVKQWPALELFQFKPELGKKYSLSEVNNAPQYQAFVRANPVWAQFHQYIKSPLFINSILDLLRRHHIDLGIRSAGQEKDVKSRLRRWKYREPRLSARWEFSMLPADGGCIRPHTDAPSKIITLVFSMMDEGEWNPAFGGGTDVLRPKDPTQSFNFINRYLDFDDVETLFTFPFDPNQCVVFVKTFNSWHSVHPMSGTQSTLMRKTLTINIEQHL
jgi:hypothetical protein